VRRCAILLASVTVGLVGGALSERLIGLPRIAYRNEWSIGIYTGPSPFHLVSPEKFNPVLTAKEVTGVRASFVADPFMIVRQSVWYMFFEVMNDETKQGDIGLAVSPDGLKWTYKQIVLDEPFHLSYPYVFQWKDTYYMVPESRQASSVRLYRADPFPLRWLPVTTLLYGDFVDPSVVSYRNRWWIFVSHGKESDELRLYYANTLEGPYTEHPKSPIVVRNARIARPAGRIVVLDNRLYRFAQDDYRTYGNQVTAFEIIDLTPARYEEREVTSGPVLRASGSGWNAEGMHHVDLHQTVDRKWMASVDGRKSTLFFRMR